MLPPKRQLQMTSYTIICVGHRLNRKPLTSEKIEDYSTILADIEIIRFTEGMFEENKNNALDMSKLNELYKNILNENGKKYEDISKNYKKHLNVLVRPTQKNKAEQLISSSKTSEIVSDVIDESATEFELKMMWDVAKIIRKDILKEKWKFNGDLNNFTALQLLSTFLKWVLIGTKNRRN